jgi:hypothetical protein
MICIIKHDRQTRAFVTWFIATDFQDVREQVRAAGEVTLARLLEGAPELPKAGKHELVCVGGRYTMLVN